MKRIFSLLLALVMVLGLAALFPPAQAKTGGKLVALTFDDGPGPYTSRLLDGLKERGVEVTFFMVGSSVSRYPELVKRMYQEGHQLANLRGVAYGTLRGKSVFLAYLVSTVLFAVYHMWSFLLDGYGWTILLYMLQYVPGGIALAWCYEKSKNIWAPVFLHMAINLITLTITVG